MPDNILIEVDLGQRALEKTDVDVFSDGHLIESYMDYNYDKLPHLANELNTKFPDAVIEAYCIGEDCCGGSYRWKIELLKDNKEI